MFQSPPFSSDNNYQYPQPFMFQPPPTNITSQYTHSMGTNDVVESPNIESESTIGSTTDYRLSSASVLHSRGSRKYYFCKRRRTFNPKKTVSQVLRRRR
ncbi:unnamed protein product [Lathyrus sativus]|nr:unnamed protein product [Lathyrus sativus]